MRAFRLSGTPGGRGPLHGAATSESTHWQVLDPARHSRSLEQAEQRGHLGLIRDRRPITLWRR